MNTKEKLNLLAAAISQLGLLYRELNGEIPKLDFVGAGASANSEVKKCRKQCYSIPHHAPK